MKISNMRNGLKDPGLHKLAQAAKKSAKSAQGRRYELFKSRERGEKMPNVLPMAVIGGLLLLATSASAQGDPKQQSYPNQPIRFVLPFPPGGATDIMARTIGQKLTLKWGQQVVVENRAGAGGSIAAEAVKRAVPDGYTLFFASSAQLAVNPGLYSKLAYDPVKDFSPIVLVGALPNILVANPSLPVKSLKEFIAYAKAHPGKLNYASPGSGSTAHLAAELLKIETGIDIVHIPYKGGAPGVTDLLGGHVPLMFISMSSVLGHIKTGKLVALGMTGPRRSDAAPNIPTFAETIPGFESTAWYGILGPAGTPKPIVEKLNAEVLSILKASDVKELFTTQGIEIIGSTPGQFGDYIKAEIVKWASVIKKSGARVD
jgi:tripartite-type tricarboxylate transporter receptor subunit TctC